MAAKFSVVNLKMSTRLVQQYRNFSICRQLLVAQSSALMKVKTMNQVDVDEMDIQKKLGTLNMNLVRKAEKRVEDKAKRHRVYRRKEWMIAGTCLLTAVGIYSYTMFAMKQEKFLDDFDMPEEIDNTKD